MAVGNKRMKPEFAKVETVCSYDSCKLKIIEKDQVVVRAANRKPYHEACYPKARPDLVKRITISRGDDVSCEVCFRRIEAGKPACEVVNTKECRCAACHNDNIPIGIVRIRPSASEKDGIRGRNTSTGTYSFRRRSL